nr:unnamed protein product [Haemonchus contortus]
MAANNKIHLKAPANKSSEPSEPSCPVGSYNCGSYGSPVKLRWNLRACSGRPLSDVYSHADENAYRMDEMESQYSIKAVKHSVNPREGKMDSGKSVFRRWPNVQINRQT